MTLPAPRVAVVGAGVAGLVASLELAHRGWAVTLLDRADAVGGKMRRQRIDGRDIDVGPTVLTMRWVFDRILADVEEDPAARLELREADIIARHAWTDGSRLDLSGDEEVSAQAIAALAGDGEAEGFRRFSAYSRHIYEVAEQAFILSPSPRFLDVSRRMGAGGLGRALRLDPVRTMWGALGRFFGDARLRQLYGRYATYYGSSPFRAPATLNLIAHVESRGVWLPVGGMYRLAEALGQMAEERGVEIRTGTEVERVIVEGGQVTGVQAGERIAADAVVMNADVAAMAGGGFGPEVAGVVHAPGPRQRSLSALVLALVAETRGFDLAPHTVFFSDDYAAEFEDIEKRGRLPASPTVYVRAQDRDAGRPEGPERLFIIINAPALGDTRAAGEEEIESCTEQAFELMSSCGLEVRRTAENTRVTTPADFHAAFPGTGGAIYGSATHSPWASMTRHGPRTTIRGLYLAGGSVHPGAGVPMAALSGRLAAGTVLEDLPTTGSSPLPAMHGGTWTG